MTAPLRRDPVQFTQESAQRIARVVRGVETSVAPSSPLTFEPYFPPKRGGGGVVIGSFTGGWQKQVIKTVTMLNVLTQPNTLEAVNLFANIATSTAVSRTCAVAKYQGGWYLIAAEC